MFLCVLVLGLFKPYKRETKKKQRHVYTLNINHFIIYKFTDVEYSRNVDILRIAKIKIIFFFLDIDASDDSTRSKIRDIQDGS